MNCMVASSIPCKLSLCADRAHARAGDSYVSSAINVACPTTQSVLAIASPHELHGDSWPSSSTGTSSFCCNQQYSVTAVTTSTGSIAERYAYTAYGQPTVLDASASVLSNSAINNRYTYTGREWDETLGLHHFRARWMSPSAGRFLGRDPIGYEGSPHLLYEFLDGRSLVGLDSMGLTRGCDRRSPCERFGSLENWLWVYCQTDCMIGGIGHKLWGDMPLAEVRFNAEMNGQACGDRANTDRNSPQNEAVRHCVAVTIVRCSLGPTCTRCLANEREVYQHRCEKQRCDRTLRGISNNNRAIDLDIPCDNPCDSCLEALRRGQLDTRPSNNPNTEGCRREDLGRRRPLV